MRQQGSVLVVSLVALMLLGMVSAYSLEKQWQYIRLLGAQQKQANHSLLAENALRSLLKENRSLWLGHFDHSQRFCYPNLANYCHEQELRLSSSDIDHHLNVQAEFIEDDDVAYWSVLLRYEDELNLALEVTLQPARSFTDWRYYD